MRTAQLPAINNCLDPHICQANSTIMYTTAMHVTFVTTFCKFCEEIKPRYCDLLYLYQPLTDQFLDLVFANGEV